MTDVAISLRSGLELILKRRKGNTSKRVELLVNKDAMVESGVIEPEPLPPPPDPVPEPSILWSPRMDSKENVLADWTFCSPYYPEGWGCINPVFKVWEDYGIPAIRFESQYPGNQIPGDPGSSMVTWREYINEATRQVPHEVGTIKYGPAMGDVSYGELHVRYGVLIDPDIIPAFNELGMKLPGFEDMGFSARMWHTPPLAGDKVGLKCYWYGASNPTGSGSGELIDTGAFLYFGRVHWIEQRIKQNTRNADGSGNPDGALEIWLDGIKVFSNTAFVVSVEGAREINNFFANFYHGGMGMPKAPMHYEFGGVAIARSYIGPPKKKGNLPMIDSFTVTPATLPAGGGQVTVAWTTSNATDVKLNGAPVATSGTLVETVSADKTYVLTITPTISQSASVDVGDAPPPPPPPPPPTGAVLTRNIAQQDMTGHSNAPNYDSVHLLSDGRIASFGDTGIHLDNESNKIQAFNPVTESIDTLAPWEQWISATNLTDKIPPGGGYNKNSSTHDNHPTGYFASRNVLVWFRHCVFDVGAGAYIRGDRPPMTQGWDTYCTGGGNFGNRYNPAYVQCPTLNLCAFFGDGPGGVGQYNTLTLWRDIGPAGAPLQAESFDLSASGVAGFRARNNAACIGTKMYVGGGQGGGPVTVASSVFTAPGHTLQDGFEFVMFPDSGQGGMPSGMTYLQPYYVRDVSGDTFRVAETPGGAALTVGNL